jgi:polar amino acid transport system substrate-binding protein
MMHSIQIAARRLLPAITVCTVLALGTSAASARTLAEVKQLGAISVCLNPDALPYSSKKPETPGFQLELAREIANGLGVKLNVEWILPRRRANVVNCDMMIDSVNDREVHEGRLLLSRPYQTSGVALGLSKDAAPITDYHELQPDQKVGVMINSIASVVVGKAGKRTSPYAFQADMVEDLEKGEIYAIAVSAATMSYYIHQHPDSGLKLAFAFEGEPDLHWEVSIGLRKSDQALVDAINAVLDKLIADGTLSAIYQRYGVEHRLPKQKLSSSRGPTASEASR